MTDITRRELLALAGAAALAPLAGCASLALAGRAAAPPRTHPALPALFDDIERRTFDFFWRTANPANGLVPDRYPAAGAPSSIAAVGFGLTAYVIGVERGFITRGQARERTLATLRFFRDAPQGPQVRGMTGQRGFFYHFIDMQTGARAGTSELSTVDTALLLAGMLHVQQFFDSGHADEVEIRRAVDTVYGRVDWPWAQQRGASISMGWHPEGGFIPHDWQGYNEAMLVVLLALGSPTHAVDATAWTAWTATYPRTWGRFMGQEHLGFAPLFGHQYSHVWIDFRGIADAPMRGYGIDYFENSRRATYSQRAYAIANPGGFTEYGADVWGLTACDGPGKLRRADRSGRMRSFLDYSARGAGLLDTVDDGTIAPTAALASLPFAPEIVIPAALEMHARYGRHIYGEYGFLDAFNRSFVATDAKLSNGRVEPGFGWVDTDWLGIDQGPILAMIANYRSESVWRAMREVPALRRGLARAGFRGGWLTKAA